MKASTFGTATLATSPTTRRRTCRSLYQPNTTNDYAGGIAEVMNTLKSKIGFTPNPLENFMPEYYSLEVVHRLACYDPMTNAPRMGGRLSLASDVPGAVAIGSQVPHRTDKLPCVCLRGQATPAVPRRPTHRDAHHVHAPLLRTKRHLGARVHCPWHPRQPAKHPPLGRSEWNVPSLLGAVLELPRPGVLSTSILGTHTSRICRCGTSSRCTCPARSGSRSRP